MNSIHFQLVTPEKTVLSEELASLTCPTLMGEITILPGHVPLVAALAPGEMHAKLSSGEDSYIFVAGGFVEVRKGNEIVVLADAAEHHHEIDVTKAEEAKVRAQKAMSEHVVGSPEYAKVSALLQQNLARINVARKHAHKKNPLSGAGVLNGEKIENE